MTTSIETTPGAPLTLLSEEELMFQESVRDFAVEKIRPLVHQMDHDATMSKDLFSAFFELGIMGIEVPDEFGGAGSTFFNAVLVVEELSHVDASCGVLVDVQNTLVNNAILRWGSSDQKSKYLRMLSADTVGAYALSEGGSGSDAFALAARAEDKGDHFVLNGRKLWITNAAESGIFIVFANANPDAGYKGITAFLIERDFPGFQVGKKEDKLGIRASSTCELILEDCRVPKENVLGEPGKGYKIAIETLNEGRIGIGAQMIGVARGALGHAIAYTKERKQFNTRIADFQGVQFQIAQAAT
ncbi:MAG: acyl-CoA dehydrogenase family protein, partial [Thermoanaerobaculia bacterium]